MSVRVVAIDGAAGSGKSTLARGLARALDLPYLNTGIMYRALTFEAIRRDVELDDGETLAALMGTLRFSLGHGDPPELEVEGSSPIAELEGSEVESHVSQVAAHPQVRALMREAQRALCRAGGVIEGRDTGSVVFPEAPVKLYLVAHAGVRAHRRAQERAAPTRHVGEALETRDERDATINPFEPPAGAVVIDTSALDVSSTLAAALDAVGRRAPGVFS